MSRILQQQLGLWGELWAVPSDYPALAPLRVIAELHGRDSGDDALTYFAYRSLLHDVIDAAAAVERAVFEAAAAEAQAWVTATFTAGPLGQMIPEVDTHAATAEIHRAYLSFADVLVWVRAIQERVDRAGPPGSRRRVGLVNVIGDVGLSNEVRSAYDALLAASPGVRYLANYALHASMLPQAGPTSALVVEGTKLVLRVPDAPGGPVDIFDQFTFKNARDARGCAIELLQSVDQFVDRLLDAFERATPERVRRQPTN